MSAVAPPAAPPRPPASRPFRHVRWLDLDIADAGVADVLRELRQGFIVFINADVLLKAHQDPAFRAICQGADLLLCDSQVLRVVASLTGRNVGEKISGSDFLGLFCRHHAAEPETRVFLLGAGPGVAARAGAALNAMAGREIVVGAHSPSFGFEKKPDETAHLCALINASGATVLAVGVGAPKQEKWMHANRHLLPGIKTFIPVGATLDFLAGNVPRAPGVLSRLGLEWAFRLANEPRRLWRRYLIDDLPVLGLLLRQAFNDYRAARPHPTTRPADEP